MNPIFSAGDTVLFQGDSITDCGRDYADAHSLGGGYAMMAASLFHARHPALNVKFFNRGISGNRAVDLLSRWQADCVTLAPQWVSILIGINDTWRFFDSGMKTETDAFEAHYRAILDITTAQTAARLILCEPFVLPVPEDRKAWREDLDPKIQVVRALARKYGALLVPFDGLFAQAACAKPPARWAEDGVHPTPQGHALMAEAWLRTVGA